MEHLEFSDLMELADIIAEKLGNPITIEDQHHHVVAYSTHGETPDPVRLETIMKRKVPESVLTRFWKDGVIQALMHSDHPVRIPGLQDLGLGNRVAISIRRGASILGYIWVQETVRILQTEDDEVLRWAARLAMPRLLQRRDRYVKKEEQNREFFWQLLSSDGNSPIENKKRGKQLGIDFPPQMLVLVIEVECTFNDWGGIQKELDYLLANLRDSSYLPFLPLWAFDEKQLIILGGARIKEDIEKDGTQFIFWLKSRLVSPKVVQLLGGFSLPFQGIEQIPKAYQQALDVIGIKKSLPEETASLSGYRELGIFRLFPFLKTLNHQEGYSNRKLEQLMAYDKANHTSLVDTLSTFLKWTGKVNRTAESLHIHPNTLHYRLKKISEIGNIDLEDPFDRVTLYIDLRLKSYLGD